MTTKRGRPKVQHEEQLSTSVNVRLKPDDYDAAYRESQRTGRSVPEVLRRAYQRRARDDDEG